ncbi:MAG: hypothetical protein QXN16_04345 [Candidatus Micrarchaeaceae archaeon]
MDILKVDVDLDYIFKDLIFERTKYMCQWLGINYKDILIKKSQNNHIHVFIYLQDPVTYEFGIFLQLLLGDDPKRYSYNELRQGAKVVDHFNILFNVKQPKLAKKSLN